jgi:hypothetical protein
MKDFELPTNEQSPRKPQKFGATKVKNLVVEHALLFLEAQQEAADLAYTSTHPPQAAAHHAKAEAIIFTVASAIEKANIKEFLALPDVLLALSRLDTRSDNVKRLLFKLAKTDHRAVLRAYDCDSAGWGRNGGPSTQFAFFLRSMRKRAKSSK